MTDIAQLTEKIRQFRDERDWKQFHNHKNLAMSLAIEAAEVLEHFQWKTFEEAEVYGRTHKEAIGEELADVAAYLFELADNLDIDLGDALERKLVKNGVKYPLSKARGVATKYTELA